MARRQIEIDRDKLRAAIRTLGTEYVVYMLDDAIDLLPPAKLHATVRKYVGLRRLRPDRTKARKVNVLADVKAFEKASLAGAATRPRYALGTNETSTAGAITMIQAELGA